MDWRNAKVEGDTITIKKKDLEEMRDHYLYVSAMRGAEPNMGAYYAGRADVLTDMLNQFEPLEG